MNNPECRVLFCLKSVWMMGDWCSSWLEGES